jgi:putative transposase
MPQSLAPVTVHIIFSTKDRRPFITKSIREELHAYLAGTGKAIGTPTLIVGGTEDHAHILLILSRTLTIADTMEELKKSSSKWLKSKGEGLRDFYWQNGYGMFPVSASNLAQVRDYITNQERHHRKMTFQEEYRLFLAKHGVEFDERYVWD